MKKLSLLIILFTGLPKVGFCQTTYTSIAGGNWNNAASVWSTDGVTPCSCTPGYVLVNDTVVVNHDITLGNDLLIDADGNVLINATGSLTGVTREIVAENGGTLVSFGPIDCKGIEIEAGSNADFHHTIQCEEKLKIEGTAQIDSSVHIIDGDLEVKETGVLTFVVPYIEVNVPSGEFKNDGTVNLNNTCVYILHGDFRNKDTGFLLGTGYIEVQDGDIRDGLGVWSTGIYWCCGGMEEDMPFAENCNGCLLILPIDLLSLNISTGENTVLLKWITATEINTAHYVVERSVNAHEWTPAGKVSGVANAFTPTHYSFNDSALPADKILYYRIGNVDINSIIDYSHVVAINNPLLPVIPLGYYNTFGRFFETLEDQPGGIYIEVLSNGNRIFYHDGD